MKWFGELLENPYLWSMFWSVVVAKVIWLMLEPQMLPGARRFAPSARSAAMAALVTTAVLLDGAYYDSPVVILLAVTFVACSDAIHRRELSIQAAKFNRLVQELKKRNIECNLPQEQIAEDAGCSLIQIVLGIVVGVNVILVRAVFWYGVV